MANVISGDNTHGSAQLDWMRSPRVRREAVDSSSSKSSFDDAARRLRDAFLARGRSDALFCRKYLVRSVRYR